MRHVWGLFLALGVGLAGCGQPVSVGGNGGPTPTPGDDDDDVTTGSFSVQAVNGTTASLDLGGSLDLTFDITPVDGYAGTVSLSSKTVLSDLEAVWEDNGGSPITSVSLDGTNAVPVTLTLTSVVLDDGVNLVVGAPYDQVFTLDFSDGVTNATLDIDLKVGPEYFYDLLPLADANDAAGMLFPHQTVEFKTGTILFIVNEGDGHRIHSSSGDDIPHMPGFGASWTSGAAWNPKTNQLYDPTGDLTNAELNGAFGAPYTDSYYCHDHGSGHGNFDVQVTVVDP